MTDPDPAAPKRRGPKPKPAASRARSVNASVPADVYRYLERVGGGSASAGARTVLTRAAKKLSEKSPEEA